MYGGWFALKVALEVVEELLLWRLKKDNQGRCIVSFQSSVTSLMSRGIRIPRGDSSSAGRRRTAAGAFIPSNSKNISKAVFTMMAVRSSKILFRRRRRALPVSSSIVVLESTTISRLLIMVNFRTEYLLLSITTTKTISWSSSLLPPPSAKFVRMDRAILFYTVHSGTTPLQLIFLAICTYSRFIVMKSYKMIED